MELEGGTKSFVNFGGGFEVEALALIAQAGGLKSRLAADHMHANQQSASSCH